MSEQTPIYQVSELGALVRRTLEQTAPRIRVAGELSGVKFAGAYGYLYATLKDTQATLRVVCFKPKSLGVTPKDGQQVIATGKLTAYPAQSNYQLQLEALELQGIGAILQEIEARKQRLTAEGLFADARKHPLPRVPQRIAMITSPTGAVIRDILHRLQARFPLPVYLLPVNVQGELAAAQIIAALQSIPQLDPLPDVVIIARGGGSIEDLMPFNDEALVRAIAACPVPVISAVGHETDVTLCDFAADLRAPTPTAAAELATPVRSDLLQQLQQATQRLGISLQRQQEQAQLRLTHLSQRLPQTLPRRIQDCQQRLDGLGEHAVRGLASWHRTRIHQMVLLQTRFQMVQPNIRTRYERVIGTENRMQRAISIQFERHSKQLDSLLRRLQALGPQQVLQRGYTLTESIDGHVLTQANQIRTGQQLKTVFADGTITSIAQ